LRLGRADWEDGHERVFVHTGLEVDRLASKEHAWGKEVVGADVNVDRTGGSVPKVCLDTIGIHVVPDAGRQRDDLLCGGLLRQRHAKDYQTQQGMLNERSHGGPRQTGHRRQRAMGSPRCASIEPQIGG
jgi:hypothetical protein